MASYTNTNVMHHLDKPIRLLMWTIDEIVCISAPIIFGFISDAWVIGFLIGISSCFCLRKFKSKIGATGGLAQFKYWAFPQQKMPKSYIKEYLS